MRLSVRRKPKSRLERIRMTKMKRNEKNETRHIQVIVSSVL
jgi:hypothetical protein